MLCSPLTTIPVRAAPERISPSRIQIPVIMPAQALTTSNTSAREAPSARRTSTAVAGSRAKTSSALCLEMLVQTIASSSEAG